MIINFEYEEDKTYFENLLNFQGDSKMEDHIHLFDFRSPMVKRKEFNKIRVQLLNTLTESYGLRCMLRMSCCDNSSKFVIDHLIPLATNKLNKELRNLKPEKGKKVKSQSFGSNHLGNLIIACAKCNNHKKHKILQQSKLKEVLLAKLD